MDVYNTGVDFIDMVGTPDVVQDIVGIEFNDDYLCKDERKAEDMYIEEEEGYDEIPVKVPHRLSDEELDQLQNI